jgi:hypothetical protein
MIKDKPAAYFSEAQISRVKAEPAEASARQFERKMSTECNTGNMKTELNTGYSKVGTTYYTSQQGEARTCFAHTVRFITSLRCSIYGTVQSAIALCCCCYALIVIVRHH